MELANSDFTIIYGDAASQKTDILVNSIQVVATLKNGSQLLSGTVSFETEKPILNAFGDLYYSDGLSTEFKHIIHVYLPRTNDVKLASKVFKELYELALSSLYTLSCESISIPLFRSSAGLAFDAEMGLMSVFSWLESNKEPNFHIGLIMSTADEYQAMQAAVVESPV